MQSQRVEPGGAGVTLGILECPRECWDCFGNARITLGIWGFFGNSVIPAMGIKAEPRQAGPGWDFLGIPSGSWMFQPFPVGFFFQENPSLDLGLHPDPHPHPPGYFNHSQQGFFQEFSASSSSSSSSPSGIFNHSQRNFFQEKCRSPPQLFMGIATTIYGNAHNYFGNIQNY